MSKKKRQGRADARGKGSPAELYRLHPGLRGRMTHTLPFLFAGCSKSWETRDPKTPRILWLIRKTVAGPALVSMGMNPPQGPVEITGLILPGADAVDSFVHRVPEEVGVLALDEWELARRVHALLACAGGRTYGKDESEWRKLLPPLPAGETADPQRYGLVDPAAAAASAESVGEVAEQIVRELSTNFDASEAGCWITREAFLEFAAYLRDDLLARFGTGDAPEPASALLLHRMAQLRCRFLLIDLSELRRATLERRLVDVSAHDVWLVLSRSEARATGTAEHLSGSFARIDSILLLLEWMQRQGLILSEPRLPGEWRGWLHRMAVEEAAGEPEQGSSAMEVLLVDLGFRPISTLRSSVRPGIQLPVYVFDVEAGRYLESHAWALDEALAALPQGVPSEEAKRRLLRRFIDALAEAGVSGTEFLQAFIEQYREPGWIINDPEPYLRWWRLGHPTRGMCSLVGCVPDPWARAPEGWQAPVMPEEAATPEEGQQDSGTAAAQPTGGAPGEAAPA